MAIVINGSGTVTGLAVGGLPDGTVDAGTLATNSVDSAELIDGAVDNSHIAALAASKLTGALPAISGASLTGITTGKVLQVVEATDTGEYDSNNTSLTNIPNLAVTLTPSASSSKFLVLISLGGIGTHSSNTGNHFALQRVISGGATSVPYVMTRSSAHDAITNSNVFGYDTQGIFLDEPSTASAITYSVQMAAYSGYSRINSNMGTNDVTSSIAVMEIGA